MSELCFHSLAATIPTQYPLWQSCVHRWHSERQRKSDRQLVVSDTAIVMAASYQSNGKKIRKGFLCVLPPPTHTYTWRKAGSKELCKVQVVCGHPLLGPCSCDRRIFEDCQLSHFFKPASFNLSAASCYRKQMWLCPASLFALGTASSQGKVLLAVLLAVSGCCVSIQLICIC